MSLKSRQRAYRNYCQQNLSGNYLLLQKRAAQRAVREYLGVTALFITMIIILVLVALGGGFAWSVGAFGAACIVFGVLVFYCVSLLRRITILRCLSRVDVSTEQEALVRCKRISFLCQPKAKYSAVILCILLKDGRGNRFCYVYPEGDEPSDFAKRYIKEQYLDTELRLICYKNTTMVKILPKTERIMK